MESLKKSLLLAEHEICAMQKELSMYKTKLKRKDKIIAELKKENIEVLKGNFQLEDKRTESAQEVTSINTNNDRSTEQLVNHCRKLQKQITEMETFLADYGLTWVGEDESNHNGSETCDSNHKNDNTPTEIYSFDFDAVMKNIAVLNELIKDGKLNIMDTSQGATFQLQSPDRIPITFYANGMIFPLGRFCEYSEPRAEWFIRDVMDGFFPSELQWVYPDGVIMEVNDKRCYYYQNEKEVWKPFTGKGFRLGSTKELASSTENNSSTGANKEAFYSSVMQ